MPGERCRICGTASLKLRGNIPENYQGDLQDETAHNRKKKYCVRCSSKVHPPKTKNGIIIESKEREVLDLLYQFTIFTILLVLI